MTLNDLSLLLNTSSLNGERYEFCELLFSFAQRRQRVSDFVDRPSFWTDDSEPHTPFSGVQKITWALWYAKKHNAVIRSSTKFALECSTANMSLVVRRWTCPKRFTTTTTKYSTTKCKKWRYMHWKIQNNNFKTFQRQNFSTNVVENERFCS